MTLVKSLPRMKYKTAFTYDNDINKFITA